MDLGSNYEVVDQKSESVEGSVTVDKVYRITRLINFLGKKLERFEAKKNCNQHQSRISALQQQLTIQADALRRHQFGDVTTH